MKSYKEMTESVLNKAHMQRMRTKRRIRNLTLAGAGLCCIILTAALFSPVKMPSAPSSDMPVKPDTEPVTEGTSVMNPPETISSGFVLLCADSENGKAKILEQSIMIPYNAEIRVLKTEGLTDAEKRQVYEKENAYVSKLWGDLADESGFGRYKLDRVMVTTISVGTLGIKVANWDTVARIRASVTENGALLSFPRVDGCHTSAYTFKEGEQLLMDIDGEDLKQCLAESERDFLGLFWHISPWAVTKLDKDPDMNLSQFSDQITIKIDFIDGSTEEATIHMLVDENGKISVMLAGTGKNA